MSAARTRGERLLVTLASSALVSRSLGRLADLRLPPLLLAPAIRAYARLYGADLSEAALPPAGYRSFNEFFTRRLAPGRRVIAREPGVVAAPTDSLLVSIGEIPKGGRLEQIKGQDYSLEALLGSAPEALSFGAGIHATLYLSPATYHRVHAPVDGRVRHWRHLRGRRFPVNRAAVRSIPGLFTRNERVVVVLDSDAHGPVAVVLVGAANVGRISLAFAGPVAGRGGEAADVVPERPIELRRGDELGAFNLGSTVILLLADPALVPAAARGEPVRVGQPLWCRAAR